MIVIFALFCVSLNHLAIRDLRRNEYFHDYSLEYHLTSLEFQMFQFFHISQWVSSTIAICERGFFSCNFLSAIRVSYIDLLLEIRHKSRKLILCEQEKKVSHSSYDRVESWASVLTDYTSRALQHFHSSAIALIFISIVPLRIIMRKKSENKYFCFLTDASTTLDINSKACFLCNCTSWPILARACSSRGHMRRVSKCRKKTLY